MNDFDFDPTAADLEEVADLMLEDFSDLTEDGPKVEEDFDFDDDYSPVDDRWSGDGIPSWSAWA